MSQTNGIPEKVTPHDIGNKPFKHDVGRGKWATTWDFYAAALSHCFGFRHFVFHLILIRSNGILLFMVYIFGVLTFTLPMYFIQMFMGQFSSTGIISAYRIAPLFKGIGYVSLILNLMTSSYLMVMAAIPLMNVFPSMQQTLPFSQCYKHSCAAIGGELSKIAITFSESEIPYHEFLNYLLQDSKNPSNFSWRIMLCAFITCTLIGLVLYNGVEMFGKILRFITITIFVCLILITIRILCVTQSWEFLYEFFFTFESSNHYFDLRAVENLIASPLLAITVFGAGWGNTLTIASYNNFKEDIGKLSLTVCFIQMIVFFITTINYILIQSFLYKYFDLSYICLENNFGNEVIYEFLSYEIYFAVIDTTHLWIILFFLMLFLSQFAESALQILTILTAIFDEFEYTRIYKKIILIILIGVFALISIFFCTITGFFSIINLYIISGAQKLFIIFIELLVVVWVYGWLRLQRDVKYMTGIVLKTWKIWMMRFITPLLIILAAYVYSNVVYNHVIFGTYSIVVVFTYIKFTSIVCIPIFMVWKLYSSSTGSILERFKKLCRPNHWYPAHPTEDQYYENFLGNSDRRNELVNVNMKTDVISV